jgi:spore germination protein YaaH
VSVLVAALLLAVTGRDTWRSAALGLGGESAAVAPGPRPVPGHEVFGYVPYWEIDAGIGAHLAATDLTTLALFSVTHTRGGRLDATAPGFEALTGETGRRLIAEAHDRGVRVELVFTSFGGRRNDRFLRRPAVQERTIQELVELTEGLGADGVNVDLEQLDPVRLPAYGAFVGNLEEALANADPDASLSVATTGSEMGAAMAAAAATSGVDRIFLMGYDYHWSGSAPGASAPLDRRDGSPKDLVWSLDAYRAVGVPVERTLLGLPLYGMAWPVTGPEIGAPRTGNGEAWIPRSHLDLLSNTDVPATVEPVEAVEHRAVRDGDGWMAIYVDSAATLEQKLGLANERGLAGAGFWAIGYERGRPDVTELIGAFRDRERPANGE